MNKKSCPFIVSAVWFLVATVIRVICVRDSPSIIGSKASYVKHSLYISIDQTEKHLEASQEIDKKVPGNTDCDFCNSVMGSCRKLPRPLSLHFHQGLIDDSHGPVSLFYPRVQMGEEPWSISLDPEFSSLCMCPILTNPKRKLNSLRYRLVSPAWNTATLSEPDMWSLIASGAVCLWPSPAHCSDSAELNPVLDREVSLHVHN